VSSTWVQTARPGRAALIATALGGLVALSRLPFEPVLGDKSPFLMAAPSMILAAFLGGLWPTVIVGLIGLWAGEVAMTSQGGPGMGPAGFVIYGAFTAVFAAAGEMRQRGLKRAKADAERLADMQLRLVQVARLNAMGEMAGTLAHELNQPLTAIASYAGAARWLAQQEPGKASEVADLLQKVADQAVRAREIIGRIRSHVSGDELKPEPQSLSAMFQDAVAGVAIGAARASTAIRYDLQGPDEVLADRVQLEQVMVNLIRNGLEAMLESPRRQLLIGSRATDEGMVLAFVADTGPGIAPEVAERLFEPFVTGKTDGMGIGLAVSRNIVEAHGGRIWAEANPEGGARFCFTLRRATEGPAA